MTTVQSIAGFVAGALMLSVLGGSIAAWSHWIGQYRAGGLVKRQVNSPQATVGFIDLLVSFLILMCLFFFSATLLRAAMPREESQNSSEVETPLSIEDPLAPESLATPTAARSLTQRDFRFSSFMSSAQIVCVLLMTVFVCARTGCSLKKMGWRGDQVMSDLSAGLQCFLMMTPPILILSAVLQQVTQVKYEHPVIEMIQKYPWMLGLAFWQAAIVAPISEEFAFRGLILGWFESIHFAKDKLHAILFGLKVREEVALESCVTQGQEGKSEAPIATVEPANLPYSPPSPIDTLHTNDGMVFDAPVSPPWWPAIISGALFGLAHFSYGVSWIPLIVFGIVLGRLYQFRQSMLPVILVHVLFNSMSLLMLGLSILLPNSVPK